jgi:hypothetical protein
VCKLTYSKRDLLKQQKTNVLGFAEIHVHRICEFNQDLKRMVEDDAGQVDRMCSP